MADSTDVTLHKKVCANPDCGRAFETPIGRQEICGAADCKRWRQARNMAKYRKPAPAWVVEMYRAAGEMLASLYAGTSEPMRTGRESAAMDRLKRALDLAAPKIEEKASGE